MPVSAISLEFIPETIDVTFNCIDHLQALGEIVLNYSVAESMKFALETWVSPEEMKQTLSDISKNSILYGDVYIKFLQSER